MKLKKIIFFSLVVFLICFIQNSAKAENDPVMITISNDKENLVFDGKWSNVNEWKQSSLNEFIFEDKNKIILRTAHQGDFIYILIDAILDFNLDKGADKAIVCFDANNDNSIPESLNCDQSNLPFASSRSRSVKPCLRAAALIWSQPSCNSNGSGPATR